MNEYYSPTGLPSFQARALSAQPRNESALVEAGFDKLPAPGALASGNSNYAVDVGMPNNIVVPVNANLTTLTDGTELVVKVISTATGAATITPGAFPIKAVVRGDNSAIRANDWVGGQIISLRYNASNDNWQYQVTSSSAVPLTGPLIDNIVFMRNAVDASKQLRLDLSSITTGNTRLLSILDRNFKIGESYISKSTRTSNTSIGALNNNNLIDITSGSFAQTFDAASTLPSGWWVMVRNAGSGDITLTPSGADTIDGLSSYIMYPGEVRLIQCDATTFTSIVLRPFNRKWTVTASNNFTKPPGYAAFSGIVTGGGAGGARQPTSSAVGPACGGGSFPFTIPSASLAQTETITIGAGGIGASIDGPGANGGVSAVGSKVFVTGGASTGNGGAYAFTIGGSGAGLDSNVSGATGFAATVPANSPGSTVWGGGQGSNNGTQPGGRTYYGGPCGGTIAIGGAVAAPGTSIYYNGSGGAAFSATSGADGTVPGAGGGGTNTGTKGGDGFRGEVVMYGVPL